MSNAMNSVAIARMIERPNTRQFIKAIFDDFMEFHGDRYYADDGAIVGGIASLNGTPVTVIGVQKGHTLDENVACNFGCPNPEGYRKALRLMKQAEKFRLSIQPELFAESVRRNVVREKHWLVTRWKCHV